MWLASFVFFGRPGEPFPFFGGSFTTLYYDRAALTECALAYRQEGPPHLRYLPLNEVESLLKGFVAQYYGVLANETLLRRFSVSYAEAVSTPAKAAFATAMAESDLFNPRRSTVLFPLSPVLVQATFDGEAFFLSSPDELTTERIGISVPPSYIVGDQFPPTSEFDGRKEDVASWLGIRSPDKRAARKWRAAILGALALVPFHRHMFTGRTIVSGVCQFKENDGISYSFGEMHTPALGYDVTITSADHEWLRRLDGLLRSTDDQSRRYVRALEYFYRAWPKQEVERFPLMFMTLDAVFGEKNNAAQIVIDAVRNLLGSYIEEKRLRELMDMRASVIHGGSPDIYDSSKYPRYIRKYDADPISDLEAVVAACLRRRVFDDTLRVHDDPNKELIERLVAEGKLPANYRVPSILDERYETDS
jgi:hypothetical protein